MKPLDRERKRSATTKKLNFLTDGCQASTYLKQLSEAEEVSLSRLLM